MKSKSSFESNPFGSRVTLNLSDMTLVRPARKRSSSAPTLKRKRSPSVRSVYTGSRSRSRSSSVRSKSSSVRSKSSSTSVRSGSRSLDSLYMLPYVIRAGHMTRVNHFTTKKRKKPNKIVAGLKKLRKK